jgi:hypothetical protein
MGLSQVHIQNMDHAIRVASFSVGAAVVALGLFTLTLAGASSAGAAAADDARDLSGVWWIRTYNPRIDPGVTAVVFTPAGKAIYDKNMTGLQNGSVVDLARKNCTPDGVVRIMASPYPFQIAQAPAQVTFSFELNNAVRTVIMDKPVPSPSEVTSTDSGHAYGRWERDTLVVESIGFTDKTFLDATGLPHSEQLRVKEYFWKGAGGKELQYAAIVFDPKTYSQLWSQRYVYEKRPDVRLTNYVCGGKNRDISQIAGAGEWK